MAVLHFITGGQRSGKSRFAQETALRRSECPVYLATARILDEDFRKRVNRHRNDRGVNWTTLEIPVNISEAEVSGKVVVMDCVTLWLTNIFFDFSHLTTDEMFQWASREFEKLLKHNADFIIVSNEIGMGGHAANELARKFTDLQGWMNQFIAYRADEVTLMVSGIPLKIK